MSTSTLHSPCPIHHHSIFLSHSHYYCIGTFSLFKFHVIPCNSNFNLFFFLFFLRFHETLIPAGTLIPTQTCRKPPFCDLAEEGEEICYNLHLHLHRHRHRHLHLHDDIPISVHRDLHPCGVCDRHSLCSLPVVCCLLRLRLCVSPFFEIRRQQWP